MIRFLTLADIQKIIEIGYSHKNSVDTLHVTVRSLICLLFCYCIPPASFKNSKASSLSTFLIKVIRKPKLLILNFQCHDHKEFFTLKLVNRSVLCVLSVKSSGCLLVSRMMILKVADYSLS